jgi:transposase
LIRFLNRIEAAVPAGKLVHAILDNYAAHKHPKVRAWLARHPRWTFHFTPTSCSWANAVETFFAALTRRRLQRGAFRSLVDPQAAINRYLGEHNRKPKPVRLDRRSRPHHREGEPRASSDGVRPVATSPKVPATLHASLMARLDRLGLPAKEVLQFGAAIGRDFSYELLATIGQWTDWELRSALGRLVAAGLVFQLEMPPRASYLFKHALVQDIAYSMLLLGLRRTLHGQIARALEERFPTWRRGGRKPWLTTTPKRVSLRRRSDIGAARAANLWRSQVSSTRSRS